MKARVRGNGEIVNVIVKEIPQYGIQGENTGGPIEYLITRFYDGENYYRYDELDFDVEPFDYWTRLEHQYAGMAMQAMLTSPELMQVVTGAEKLLTKGYAEKVAIIADKYAHALVEELKEKEERK